MKKIILLVGVVGVLAGCAPQPPIGFVPAKDIDITTVQCDILVTPLECDNEGSGNRPSRPDVHFNNKRMSMSPRNVCVDPESTLEIRISPRTYAGAVHIRPKNPAHVWLEGSNDKDWRKVEIKIAGDPGNDYEYTIVFNDGKKVFCVDPRIHVQ